MPSGAIKAASHAFHWHVIPSLVEYLCSRRILRFLQNISVLLESIGSCQILTFFENVSDLVEYFWYCRILFFLSVYFTNELTKDKDCVRWLRNLFFIAQLWGSFCDWIQNWAISSPLIGGSLLLYMHTLVLHHGQELLDLNQKRASYSHIQKDSVIIYCRISPGGLGCPGIIYEEAFVFNYSSVKTYGVLHSQA